MDDDRNPQTGTKNSTKKRTLTWIAGGCVGIAAIVVLVYVLTTPPTPAEAAEEYIEDHYDAVTEAVVHAAFPDNPLKAEIIAEVAESTSKPRYKGGEKVYHWGGGIVYHRHDEKGLNWESGGVRSGAGVRRSGVSQESSGSSETWEAAFCQLWWRR